jgi:hypothetical protein
VVLGDHVVCVTDRLPGNGKTKTGSGGTYHQPTHQPANSTACGLRLNQPTLMQQEWAQHTRALPCPDCYPETAVPPAG